MLPARLQCCRELRTIGAPTAFDFKELSGQDSGTSPEIIAHGLLLCFEPETTRPLSCGADTVIRDKTLLLAHNNHPYICLNRGPTKRKGPAGDPKENPALAQSRRGRKRAQKLWILRA